MQQFDGLTKTHTILTFCDVATFLFSCFGSVTTEDLYIGINKNNFTEKNSSFSLPTYCSKYI